MISNTLSKGLTLRIGTKDDPPNDKEKVRQQSTTQEVRPTSCSQSQDNVIGNDGETLGMVQLSESLASNSEQQMNESEEESLEKRYNAHIKTLQNDDDEDDNDDDDDDLFKTAYEMGFLSKDESSEVE